MRTVPQKRLSTKELRPFNCGAVEESLRVPWTARKSNQSILKEINPEDSLESAQQSVVSGPEKTPYVQSQFGGHEEIPHVQSKRNPSKMAGTERGHQRADRLK